MGYLNNKIICSFKTLNFNYMLVFLISDKLIYIKDRSYFYIPWFVKATYFIKFPMHNAKQMRKEKCKLVVFLYEKQCDVARSSPIPFLDWPTLLSQSTNRGFFFSFSCAMKGVALGTPVFLHFHFISRTL